jgi:hypothetical protein
MKLTVETKAIDKGIAAFRRRLALLRLRKSYVKAGVLGKKSSRAGVMTNAQLASIHEYGLGKVPPRPFIQPPFVLHKADYLDLLRKGYAQAMRTNNPDAFRRVLALIGQKMAADIRNYVTQGPGVMPPNSPRTIARKGSSRPLVDTGQMIRAVEYEVVE